MLVSYEGKKIPDGKDFDPATGKLTKPELLQLNEAEVNELRTKLLTSDFQVTQGSQ